MLVLAMQFSRVARIDLEDEVERSPMQAPAGSGVASIDRNERVRCTQRTEQRRNAPSVGQVGSSAQYRPDRRKDPTSQCTN
jgi:hypothetical protein